MLKNVWIQHSKPLVKKKNRHEKVDETHQVELNAFLVTSVRAILWIQPSFKPAGILATRTEFLFYG